VTLADTSEGMLAVLREKIAATGAPNLHPLRLDLQVDAHAERYDLLCSLMTLHHIPDTTAILARFHEALTPGAWLALADLDAEDGSFHGPEVDVHPGFDRATLQAQLEAAGFEAIHFSTPCEVRKGDRVYPVFLVVARRP
jgi:trans-aconitate methyltransferase